MARARRQAIGGNFGDGVLASAQEDTTRSSEVYSQVISAVVSILGAIAYAVYKLWTPS